MIPHTISNTIETLEEHLHKVKECRADRRAGTKAVASRMRDLDIALQSALHHLRQLEKMRSHGGDCDYIITMTKEQYRKFDQSNGKKK